MFEREELLAALDTATPLLRAMILLGINAGMGGGDCAMLPTSALDLKKGWLDFPRPKTGVGRRIPLWRETIDALKEVIATRHAPNDPADKDLVFIGPRGESFIGSGGSYRVTNPMLRLLERSKIARKGLSFYSLRHTFQTVAEGARDLAAVQSIMGHSAAAGDMSAVYRERVDDARLLAVVQHVHDWLFPVAQVKEMK
jgi:integrase